MWFGKKKQRCSVNTIAGHIKNMITGVTKGYRFKMKLAYEHFPINPVIEKPLNPKTKDIGKVLVLTKFLGENIIRKVEALEGVTIQNDQEKKKDEIVVEGIDLEATSKTCTAFKNDFGFENALLRWETGALIHQSCQVRHKDIRKFLDGVYVQEVSNQV